MERRHREISLDEVDMGGPALVHVDTGGGIILLSAKCHFLWSRNMFKSLKFFY